MKRIFQDQMMRQVEVNWPPKRIVSLVPSLTEYLIDLCAPLVGRTKFCIHPEELVAPIAIVGGTKNFHLDRIKALQPDLIIGNQEENDQGRIEALASQFPVWMSRIQDLPEMTDGLTTISTLVDREKEAQPLLSQLKKTLEELKQSQSGRVLYLIWKSPYMAAGKETYIDALLSWMGYENVIQESRYPAIDEQLINQLKPDTIMLSSEPYPFGDQVQNELQVQFPHSRIELVDGAYYSWYGTRILKS